MNLLFKLLLIVIASAGATGHYARAPLGESNSRPQMWTPRVAQAPALPLKVRPAVESQTPVYVASVPAGAKNGLVSGSASDESVRRVPVVAVAAAYSVRVPVAAAGSEALVVPERSPSEPSGWALLLSSLVVVGFIARRRSRTLGG